MIIKLIEKNEQDIIKIVKNNKKKINDIKKANIETNKNVINVLIC